MRPRLAFFLLGAALSGAACGRAPPPEAAHPAPARAAPASAATRAASLMAARGSLAALHGRRDHDGHAADYTAYFDGEQLRYLEEQLHTPAGVLQNTYYFEAGALYYYRGEQPAAAAAPGPGGASARVAVQAEFRGAQTLQAVRVEHFGEVPLGADAVAAIRRTAALLAAAAIAERRAPLPSATGSRPIA